MKALILAAGEGNRLGLKKPKALVLVNGKALLTYQIELLQRFGIKRLGVVTGFQAGKVSDFIQTIDLPITLFENPHYQDGNLLSLQAASSFLDDDFLLMNVDHIYPNRLFKSFLQKLTGIAIACDFDRALVEDDMKVERDAKGHLKAIHKKLTQYDGGYIGMTFCPRAKIPTYLSAQETTLAKLGLKASVEMILAELANSGEKINIVDTSGTRWLEIDTVADLNFAEATLRRESIFLA